MVFYRGQGLHGAIRRTRGVVLSQIGDTTACSTAVQPQKHAKEHSSLLLYAQHRFPGSDATEDRPNVLLAELISLFAACPAAYRR
jgi:hypothetical protein